MILLLRQNLHKIFLFLTVFVLVFRPPIDPDLWWHLKYGELIFKTHSVPASDIFSYTLSGYHWANSYWASDLVLYLVFLAGGFAAIPVVLSALFAISILYFSNKLKGAFLPTLLASAFSAVSIYLTVAANRPILFSAVFFVILWRFFLFEDFKGLKLLILPALFLFWVNMHADFVVGLAIFLTFIFFKFLTDLSARKLSKNTLMLCIIWLTCAATVVVNPFGTELIKTLLNERSLVLQFSVIKEWQPVSFKNMYEYIYFVLLLSFDIWSLLFVIKKYPLFADKYKRWFVSVVVIMTAMMSIRSIYFIRALSIFSFPLIYYFFNEFSPFASIINATKMYKKILYIILVLDASILLLWFTKSFVASFDVKESSALGGYPYGAVQFIRKNKPEGNMFNSYVWGGYLIYYLPEYKTFIDGRMTSWNYQGKQFLQTYLDIEGASDSYLVDKELEKYGVGFTLLKPSSSLNSYLQRSGWKKVYEDKYSVVLERQK